MRIVYFTSVDGWGGSESYLLTLMAGVRARGHDVILLGIEGARLFKEVSARGWECKAWRQSTKPFDGTDETGSTRSQKMFVQQSVDWRRCVRSLLPFGVKLFLGNVREAMWLFSLMKASRPDVVHISVNGYEAAAFASRVAGIPSLAMCMITPPDEPYWLRRWLMRGTVRLCSRAAAQSRACMDAWIAFAGLRAHRCSYIWNGVDVRRFGVPRVERVRKTGEPFRLVCAARLHPMKGINYLVDAMAAMLDLNVVLNIFGTGEEEEPLRRQAVAGGVADRIHFRGHTERLEEVFAQSDAFVLASVSHESGPAVLSEAMASGLPLITTDFGPLAEINVDKETGVVVPVRDAEALAAAVRQLAGDSELCWLMGQAAKARAEHYFSSDCMIDQTLQVYESLLSRR